PERQRNGGAGSEQRLGPDGQPLPREPRPPREQRLGPDGQPVPREPRLGPDGQPLPRRDRKPIGPDANGMGPDGKPWDPARRAQRLVERQGQPGGEQAGMNAQPAGSVEGQASPSESAEAPKE
ncbi:MAG: hypothetical protein H0T42_33630, partial [Deltaproteobacteria bacterium]|nr:hypothetical protein [Deltaproteobacteria bacterium]